MGALPLLEKAARDQDAAQHSGTECFDHLMRQLLAFQKFLPAVA